MQKIIKRTAIIIGILFLLIFTGAVYFISYINPNDYKPQLSKMVAEKTGRELTLAGNLRWSFYPWLGLEAKEVKLSNAKNFGDKPFAQIKEVAIKVELLPLLKREVRVAGILLEGLELNLTKNSNGITNWQDLGTLASTRETNPKSTPSADASTANQPFALAIAGININNGTINWTDQQKGQFYNISQLQIRTKKLQPGASFPLDVQFILKSKKLALQADIHFDGTAMVGLDKQVNLDGKLETKTMQMDTTIINTFTAQINAQVDAQQQFSLQGKLQAAQVQLDTLKLTALNTNIKLQNGLITLNPITAQLYQGNYNGTALIDTRKSTPQITTDANLSGIEIEPLLRDLNAASRLQLTGTGNVKTHLTLSLGENKSVINSLKGQGQLALNNGVVKGIDIAYWITVGKALIKHQSLPAQTGTNQTNFGNLTASFAINNGTVRNEDLLLQAVGLQLKGNGSISLVTKTLDYTVTAQPTHPDTNQPDSIAIPLRIQGPLSSPSVHPVVDSLLKSVAEHEIAKHKDQIKEKLNEAIGKNIGEELGDKLKNQLNNLLH